MVDAAPEAVLRKHRHGRPWVSVRPHYRGLPLKLAGRGTGERREIAVSQVPGSADRGLKDAARERRKAFPWPLFS